MNDFDLVILNATVVTMNASFDVLERAAVAVRDGYIARVCPVGELPAGWTARQTIDAPGGVTEGLKLAEGFINEWQGHARITPAVAPHAPYTCSPATLQAARDLAQKTATPLLIHLSETQHEVDDILKRYGATPIHYA